MPSRCARRSTTSTRSQVKPYFEMNNVLRERRLLRRQPALRHHLQGAQGHSGLPAGRARVRGVRRRRQAAGAVLLRLFQARQQAGRRLDETTSSSSRSCWAPSRWSTTSATSAKPAPGQPALLSFRRREHDVPRIRPRAAWHVRERRISDAVGHRVRARLRGVPFAVQRTLGDLSGGVRALRQALQDRRAHAGGTGRKIKKSANFNKGYEVTELLAAAQLDMQWHSLPPDAPMQDVARFETQALEKTTPFS